MKGAPSADGRKYMSYVNGKIIRELREKKNLTQKQLADSMQISDKTVSKWETDRGLPDIGLIGGLAEALGVSVAELLVGEVVENKNRHANMLKSCFYVCPICGNVIHTMGEGTYSCCGIKLPKLEIEMEATQAISVAIMGDEYYIHSMHEMSKEHYISFIAYVTENHSEIVKLYPEQSIECSFLRRGHGFIYAYCNKDGLYRVEV